VLNKKWKFFIKRPRH